MDIQLAKQDSEIAACFPVMKQLRQDLTFEQFVPKIRALEPTGFMLAYLAIAGSPVTVSGFRLGESLAWKRYLYVDDLVTLTRERSNGYGSAMLHWLMAFAREQNCVTFHLDSGVQRIDAHRFYEREGLQKTSYHFAVYINT